MGSHDADIFREIWSLGYRPKLINIEVVWMKEEDQDWIRSELLREGYQLERDGDDLVAVKL